MTNIQQQLQSLLYFADVRLHRTKNEGFVASCYPKGHAPLWWFGEGTSLEMALQSCWDTAVQMRFVKEEPKAQSAQEPEDEDSMPNHFCIDRFVHLPNGEGCDKCGIGGRRCG